MLKPLVSIIIPAFNAETFITAALDSIWAQTYTKYEVIVVDDGSTDTTAKILKNYKKIIFLQQENKGISSARNLALKYAQGEVIAFLDADDVWLPEKLEKQIEVLTSNRNTQMVFSFAQNFLDKKITVEHFYAPIMAAHIPSTCLFNKQVLDVVGVFSPKVKFGEFTEWYGRVIDANIIIECIPQLLTLRRIHGENIGIRNGNLKEYVHILKKKIERNKLRKVF